jgi:hypothetical protein
MVETALVQFTNWVDCKARSMPCDMPDRELMQEAGFEEIDHDYWINYQKSVISRIEERDDLLIAEERPPATTRPNSSPSPPAHRQQGTVSTEPQDIPLKKSTDTERIAKIKPSKGSPSSTQKIDKKKVKDALEETQVIDPKTPPPKKGFFSKVISSISEFLED